MAFSVDRQGALEDELDGRICQSLDGGSASHCLILYFSMRQSNCGPLLSLPSFTGYV